MRLVLDTDVVLSGLRSSTGASRVLLLAVREQAVRPLATVAMMLEYEDVLKRPKQLAATGLDVEEVDAFLDNLARFAEPVVPHYSYRPTVRDPDDELLVDAAVNGRADAIVSFNASDLKPSDPKQGELGIPVYAPGEILRRLTWRPTAATLSAFRPL